MARDANQQCLPTSSGFHPQDLQQKRGKALQHIPKETPQSVSFYVCLAPHIPNVPAGIKQKQFEKASAFEKAYQ